MGNRMRDEYVIVACVANSAVRNKYGIVVYVCVTNRVANSMRSNVHGKWHSFRVHYIN